MENQVGNNLMAKKTDNEMVIYDIGDTIKYYQSRVKMCKTVPDQVEKAMVKVQKLDTIAKLKAFLSEQKKQGNIWGKTSISKMKKNELVEKAKNVMGAGDWKVTDANTKIDKYNSQIELLKKLQHEGVFNKLNEIVKNANNLVEYEPFDYDTLPHTWGYPIEIAQKLYDALKPHEGEICVLTGGGKMITDPDNYMHIEKVTLDPTYKTAPSVKVEGHIFTGRQTLYDSCSKKYPKNTPAFDVEKASRGIQSWQIQCLKPK